VATSSTVRHAKKKNLVLIDFYYCRTNLQKENMDDQDDLQDDAAANAVAVAAAAIAAARILEVRYCCLEVCGLNQQMTNTIILDGYS